jgi:hypothetical protein
MFALTSASTGTEYEGQWVKNRFHGEGSRRFLNGNIYTGSYVCGQRQGLGRCYFANGDMYVGDWKKVCLESNNPAMAEQQRSQQFQNYLALLCTRILFMALADTITTMVIASRVCFVMVSETAEGNTK